MLREVLYVNIGYENGLFVLKNNEVCSEISEDIMVNTPFYNQENSFEELLDTISMEPEEDIVFSYHCKNQKLVRKLAAVLAEEYGKTVYLVNSNLKNALCYLGGETMVYMLQSYDVLETINSIELEVVAQIPVLVEEQEENLQGYYAAMKNGYDAYITGVYPADLSNTLAKHVELEAAVVVDDVSRYLDLNGAFLVNGDAENDIEIQDKEHFNHLHTVKEDEVRFDSTGLSFKKMVCSYSQYAKWKESGKLDPVYDYYLKIENEQDLNLLAEELEAFKADGKMDTISRRLVDECRLANQCSLKKLTRYRVEKDVVKPCITSEKTLLAWQEEPSMQLLEANKLYDKTMIQSKCVDCDMSAVCSKCACLPEGISRETYCEFIHKYPFVGEYLMKKRIVNFLGRFSKVFEGDRMVEISSNIRCMEYESCKKAVYGTRNVYVFKKDGNYYVLHMRNGNLVKVDRKYVFLMEAWALEEDIQTIVQQAAIKYELNEEQAGAVVREGYEQLRKAGIIA